MGQARPQNKALNQLKMSSLPDRSKTSTTQRKIMTEPSGKDLSMSTLKSHKSSKTTLERSISREPPQNIPELPFRQPTKTWSTDYNPPFRSIKWSSPQEKVSKSCNSMRLTLKVVFKMKMQQKKLLRKNTLVQATTLERKFGSRKLWGMESSWSQTW